MKKILFILSLVLLVACGGNENKSFTLNEVRNPQDSSNIQYNIKWDNINSSPVDIRIVTLIDKNGESHDYVVANNYIGRAGGLDIDHWPGCWCFKDKNNKNKNSNTDE